MKTVFLFILSCFLVIVIKAQTTSEIQNAFKKSYEYEASGDYTNAISELKKVYKEDSYEINLRLGWLNYMSGMFTDSQAYYTKAISIMNYSIEARLGVVLPAAALGNTNLVSVTYKKILEIDPKNTTANYKLGLIYYQNNDYENAIKCFESNVNLYPFSYDSMIMLAWSYLNAGKTREAKILFNKALMYNPGDESASAGLKKIE